MSEPSVVLYREGTRFGFEPPPHHEVELTPSGLIRLEAVGHGGLYNVLRVADTTDGAERHIYLGSLEQGWWDAAAPGVPASYVFPTVDEEIECLYTRWAKAGGFPDDLETEKGPTDDVDAFLTRVRAAVRGREQATS